MRRPRSGLRSGRPSLTLAFIGILNPAMTIIQCEQRRHAAQVLSIFNEAIVNSTALYDYKPRTPEMMQVWFEAKAKGNFPVNNQGERREATAAGDRMQTELNGWLPSAGCCCSASLSASLPS